MEKEILISGIYKWTSPNGRVYVGQAEDLEEREKDYKYLYSSKGQRRLYNSFIKNGFENHIFDVIERCLIDDLNRRERYWQEYYDVLSSKGMNCFLTNADEKRRVFSDETRRRMSKGQLGKIIPQEVRDKIRNTLKGVPRPKEVIEKIMKNRSKVEYTEEIRKNMSLGQKGKIHSASSIEKRCKKIRKPILQFDLDDNFIREWESITQAVKELNIQSNSAITRALQGKTYMNISNGYRWKYKLTKIEN